MKVPITIREYPPAMMIENYPFELSRQPVESTDLGLRLETVTAAARVRVGLPEHASGVEVTSVPPGSAADRAGLRTGDVIVQVQDTAVAAPADVHKDLQEGPTQNGSLRACLFSTNLARDGWRWRPNLSGHPSQ